MTILICWLFLYSVILSYLPVLSLTPHCIDYCSFIKVFKLGRVDFVLLQYYVGCSESFAFQFIDIYKIICQDFDWDSTESADELGRSSNLTILNLPIYNYVISLHLFKTSLISSQLCSFAHLDLVYIFFDLSISISFCSVANVIDNLFLISISNYSLWH